MAQKMVFPFLILAFLVASCVPSSTDAQAFPTTEDISIAIPQPSSTMPLPTPTETATALPTVVPTATVTPVFWPSTPITLENTGDIQEVNRWGRGTVERSHYLKTNEAIILTPLGLYLYQVEPIALLAQIDDVNHFVVSDDEKWLAVSKDDGAVEVWSLESKAVAKSIQRALPQNVLERIEKEELVNRHVIGMAFSPDASEIAIGYLDGLVDLWRIEEETPYVTLQNDYLALGPDDFVMWFLMKYSPDGKSLVVARQPILTTFSRLTFWNIPDGTLISVSQPARFMGIPSINYGPDSSEIIVIESDQSFQILGLWDAQTGNNIIKINTSLAVLEPGSLELLSDGEQIGLRGHDSLGNIFQQQWAIANGKPLESIKLQELPLDQKIIKFTDALFQQGHYQTLWPDGDGLSRSKIAALDNQSFRITLQDHWFTLPDGSVRAFNLPEDNIRPSHYDFQEEALTWCTNNTLYWKDRDDNTRVIDLQNLTPCDGAILSPKKRFAVGWNDTTVLILNLETKKFNRIQLQFPYRLSVRTTAFSEDERFLIMSENYKFTAFVVEPEIRPLNRAWADNISHILFLKNNEDFVALSGNDAFLPDDKNDIYTNNRITVWNASRLDELGSVNTPRIGTTDLRARFTGFALSPDETILATGDDLGHVRLWDFSTRQELQVIEFDYGHTPVALAFTPDGSGLLVVLADGTIRLLGLP